MKTTPLDPFLGMNNRLPDTKLHVQDKGDFVRNAVNVDVTTAGTVKRREGVTQLMAGAACHSFYGHGEVGYYVDGTNLFQLYGDAEGPSRTLIRADVPLGHRLSFCTVAGRLIYTDGQRLHALEGVTSTPFTLPSPNTKAEVVVGAGALPPGLYQVAYTLLGDAGQESGASRPVQVEVPANGSLTIKVPSADTCIYVSPCNGDQLFFAGYGPELSVVVPVDGGHLCQTLNLAPLPGGDIVRYRNGRTLVAKGEVLFYSQPFAPALYDPVADWIAFPAPITVLEPMGQGTWVVADKTYWLAGPDITKAELVQKLPYGAAFGSSLYLPLKEEVVWLSEKGVCLANGDGAVENVQSKSVATGAAQEGATIFKERDGMQQIVATGLGGNGSLASAKTFMEAEVIRKETEL